MYHLETAHVPFEYIPSENLHNGLTHVNVP
jgi:hypothetical protein